MLSIRSLFIFAFLTIFTVLGVSSCGEDFTGENLPLVPKENNSKRKQRSKDFDGTYELTFKREVSEGASSTTRKNAFWTITMSIADGRGVINLTTDVDGVLLRIKGEIQMERSGRVSGEIQVEREGQNIARVDLINSVINVSGQVQGEYSYFVLGREIKGTIQGVRVNDTLDFNRTSIVTRYDGLYSVDFIRDGEVKSNACIIVENGRIIQTLDQGIAIEGIVGEDGDFLVFSSTHSLKTLSAEGKFTPSGGLTGNYELDVGSGTITGQKTNDCDWSPISVPSVQFDGIYQVQFIREGIVQSVTCIVINRGEISQTLDGGYTITGSVNNFGNFKVAAAVGTGNFVIGEGLVDSTGKVSGTYEIELGSGFINGKRVDNCEFRPINNLAGVRFDGTYQVDFIMNGQVRDVACIFIRNGQVSQTLRGGYAVTGSIDTQGTFLMLASPNSSLALTAEGLIDSSGNLRGSYEVVEGTGTLIGKQSGQCTGLPVSVDDPGPGIFGDSFTSQAFAANPGLHSLCQVDIQFDLLAGIKGLFEGITETLGTGDKIYCKAGSQCNFLDERRQTYTSGDACISQCEWLAKNDSQFEPGCLGLIE